MAGDTGVLLTSLLVADTGVDVRLEVASFRLFPLLVRGGAYALSDSSSAPLSSTIALCNSGKSLPTLAYIETTFHDAKIRLSKLGKAVLTMLLNRFTLICVGMVSNASLLTLSGIVSRPMRGRLLDICLTTSLRLRGLPSAAC